VKDRLLPENRKEKKKIRKRLEKKGVEEKEIIQSSSVIHPSDSLSFFPLQPSTTSTNRLTVFCFLVRFQKPKPKPPKSSASSSRHSFVLAVVAASPPTRGSLLQKGLLDRQLCIGITWTFARCRCWDLDEALDVANEDQAVAVVGGIARAALDALGAYATDGGNSAGEQGIDGNAEDRSEGSSGGVYRGTSAAVRLVSAVVAGLYRGAGIDLDLSRSRSRSGGGGHGEGEEGDNAGELHFDWLLVLVKKLVVLVLKMV